MPKRLLEELKLVASYVPYLPKLFMTNKDDFIEQGEIQPSSYSGIAEYISVAKDLVVQKAGIAKNTPRLIERASEDSDIKFYFLNGICTNIATACVNATLLSKLVSSEVGILHNPTSGILVDLYEVLLSRSFGIMSETAQFGMDIIVKDIKLGKKVVLLGHSQGGIIASNIVRTLLQDHNITDEDLRLLEIYTFGSAACSQPNRRGLPYSEHFANGYDFVARVGILHHRYKVFGKLFVAEERSGHLLNTHYLSGLADGCYGKGSRLFDYIG